MLQASTLLFFPMLMMFAAISDLFTMTISNRISIALVLIFIPLALFGGVPLPEIGIHLACGAGILVVTFGMFAFGWIGGGDAKLAAATAVWIGWDHLGDYGVAVALLGGALTLGILMFRNRPLPRWGMPLEWMTRLHDKNGGVPYGIALATAGLFVYPDTSLWIATVVA